MDDRYAHLRNEKKPTRQQEKLYRKWREYLRDSRLNEAEQHRRASAFADQLKQVPHD